MSATAPQSTGLGRGLAYGLGGALVGAAAWAALTALTNVKIGFAAIGIGLLVGFATQRSRSIDPRLPMAAAGLALLGCVLGDVFFMAHDQARLGRAAGDDVSTWFVLRIFLENPDILRTAFADYFRPFDLLFYGLAAYEGFKFARLGVEKAKHVLTPPPAYSPADMPPAYSPPADGAPGAVGNVGGWSGGAATPTPAEPAVPSSAEPVGESGPEKA